MIKREELLRSETYYTTNIQLDLFRAVEDYMETNELNRTQFAERLGVSKGRLSQILNGDFNGRLDRLVALALAAGKAPVLELRDLDEHIAADAGLCWRDPSDSPKPVEEEPAIYLHTTNVHDLLSSVESAHSVGYERGGFQTMVSYRTTHDHVQPAPSPDNRLEYV